MRVRLRESRSPAEEEAFYAARYPTGYNHAIWPDHVERVAASVAFIRENWVRPGSPDVVDLSCGDGQLTVWAARQDEPAGEPDANICLGDLNFGSDHVAADRGIFGPLRETIPLAMSPAQKADLYVCSETLEHLDDPDEVLALLRPRAKALFVSTPYGETNQDNEEHYWGWDVDGVREMLAGAGWVPQVFNLFTPKTPSPYTFQFWMCT